MELELGGLTEQIIGAAIEVHRRLGPGFLESIYEKSLLIELGKRGLFVESQVLIDVLYDGHVVGQHRLDLVVERSLVVELKTVRDFDDVHFVITRSYLRALNLRHGLLLNFAKVKLEVKRVRADPL